MTSIRLENVHVNFGKTEVLRDISLEVADGELCVIVGPSGCGKTVTLRAISGLTRPSRGHVYFDDNVIDHVAPGDRNVGMAFQTYALYPNMTVRENWEFPLRAAKRQEELIQERVGQVTGLLDMGPLLNRYPRELSGGQQQRVALGRALVRRPQVFLLDEPMGNLDAKLRVELRASLRKLQMDLGVTTVYVTHDQVDAQALGDKIVVMDVGSVQQVGTPEQIYETPANLFVAGFIGTPRMNFLDGTLKQENGNLVVEHPLFKMDLPEEVVGRLADNARDRKVVMGVRPESIGVSTHPGPQTIPGKIYVCEPQSNEVIIEIELEEEVHLKVRVGRDALGFEPYIDQLVQVQIDPDTLHFFDSVTGVRLS
ncbi:MAG: ABC transporter ATP-binding protein [Deltaproteobacteria bacterium]|nr:MAG: ABC transporter ATP-binding protein [Deltaproteobacteria bacterium]